MSSTTTDPTDAYLESQELIRKYGYTGESHEATTEDGYILSIDRIIGKQTDKHSTVEKPVVLLMPCLMGTSAHFLCVGKKSLGFRFSNEGYDVWMGNPRGSRYCKSHDSLDPKKKEFWNFTFHEIGVLDLPAIIDYILTKTKQEKLSYVGHSQGAAVFFILMAEKPEYNNKIKIMHSLGMSIVFEHVGLRFWSKLCGLLNLFKIYEFSMERIAPKWFIRTFCGVNSFSYNLGAGFMGCTTGLNRNQYEAKELPIIMSQFSSVSAKQIKHCAQMIKSKKFVKYDYGSVKNLELYEQADPPEYNYENITSEIVLHYAELDKVMAAEDIVRSIGILPNVIGVNKVMGCHHLDFLWARDIEKLVFNKIVESLKSYN